MRNTVLRLAVAIVALALPAAAFAQVENWEGHFEAKNVALSAGVGASYRSGDLGVAGYPGAEFIVAKWKSGDVVPLSFGIAARGLLGFSTSRGLVYGGGAFGTFHLGLKGLDIPEVLQNLDFYVGVGVAFTWSSYYATGYGLGINSYGGLNYFLSDKLAVQLEESYWGYYAGTTVGLLLKL